MQEILITIPKTRQLEKILVPTDFAELSNIALDYASSIAETYGADVYLMHVIEQSDHYQTKINKKQLKQRVPKDLLKEVKDNLMKLVDEKLQLVDNVQMVVAFGNPYKEIIKFCVENKIGLIVLATHGRTGFAHVVIGSVAEKIVRYSPVPVLTVKPEELGDKFLTSEDVEKELHINFKKDDVFG